MENEIPQPDEQLDYSLDQYYVGKEVKQIKLKCVECKNKFSVPRLIGSDDDRSTPAFCFRCSQRKCLQCSIVLSSKYKCKNKICKEPYHCMPSKYSPDRYCEGCVDYIHPKLL